MGTDAAMVGVWDPGVDRDHQPDDYLAFLESEADAGRLLFINTGSDGSCPACIYVDEQPDPEDLALYTSPGRAFLIESVSGWLIAGGVEDFGSRKPVTTSETMRSK